MTTVQNATYPKNARHLPRLPKATPDFTDLDTRNLKSTIKFYRHRMGYWRDRAETICAEVEAGRLDAAVCRAAMKECLRTMQLFIAAVEERDRRKALTTSNR